MASELSAKKLIDFTSFARNSGTWRRDRNISYVMVTTSTVLPKNFNINNEKKKDKLYLSYLIFYRGLNLQKNNFNIVSKTNRTDSVLK